MRLLVLLAAVFWASQAAAFCGFYVARADGELYNEASKVVFVRDGRNSTITMSSDYRGPASEFALIVPTPTVLREDQIATVAPETVAHLDRYSAPRLVEYFDADPCNPVVMLEMAPTAGAADARTRGARALGVTIEAEYAVGDYDIAILSATQSDGLVTFLRQDGYQIPDGADLVLADYVAGGMKFFVARVNLARHSANGKQELRPLQISFRSRNFMLPLQLGKINSAGTQDLLILTLTREGRVEAENYRNARIPSDIAVPSFVRDLFGQFYVRMFARAAPPDTVMTEYAWDMAWCDPCADDPLTAAELRELGASWVPRGDANPGQNVFVTRMHVQYTAATFQRDLLFRVTGDTGNFQGRYIMNQPWDGALDCPAAQDYVRTTRARIQREAQELQQLTGWRMSDIQDRIRRSVPRRYQ